MGQPNSYRRNEMLIDLTITRAISVAFGAVNLSNAIPQPSFTPMIKRAGDNAVTGESFCPILFRQIGGSSVDDVLNGPALKIR
jgi:hypothetical protein